MKRYKLLRRLLAILILIIFLPTVFYFSFFTQRSYKELIRANEAYYNKLADTFMELLIQELTMLKKQASVLCANSRNHASVFWYGEENWTQNAYWYYDAIQEFNALCSDVPAEECGIYYYESNSIITKRSRQTRENYETNTLEIDDPAFSFFDPDTWDPMRFVFGTTNTQDNLDGDFLIGYCVQLGRNAEQAMIFYRLTPANCGQLLSFASNNSDVEFYVLDMDSHQVDFALRKEGEATPSVDEITRNTAENGSFSLSCSVRTLSNSLQSQTADFYRSMTSLWLIMATILFVISFVALYLAYRPLYRLTLELTDTREGEIESIRSALQAKDMEIMRQQRLIVTNLLINHLLYGGEISGQNLQNLGKTAFAAQAYCVYILIGEAFLDGETDQLSHAVEAQFQIKLFIADTEDDRKKVAIAFLNGTGNEDISLWMHQWLNEHFSADYSISIGKTVDKLDDIRTSFVSCYQKSEGIVDLSTAKKALESMERKEEQRKKLLDEILLYLDHHFCDSDLSQSKVADTFHISNYTLSRLFNSRVDVGFSEFINAKRIGMAKSLLETTDISVGEIANQVGIPNYNYFLRLFKDSVGRTPTNYRTEAKNGKTL